MIDLEAMMSRYRGALLGLAVGDALGTTLEFKSPGTFEPISDMMGGGPFKLEPGQWTDDTSMALCLAESLLSRDGFDPEDQMRLYLSWYQTGHNSSNGKCFDIGNTVRYALDEYEVTGRPYSGPTAEKTAGNGSLMRLAPIPMFYRESLPMAYDYGVESSRTTHGSKLCLDCCGYYSLLIAMALEGTDKGQLFEVSVRKLGRMHKKIDERLARVIKGSFREKEPPEIRGTGYVLESLEAALWAFWKSESFEEGALMAVNLGEDADTTGAIYGQLAGAHYGDEMIPAEWVEKITDQKRISTMAEALFQYSQAT